MPKNTTEFPIKMAQVNAILVVCWCFCFLFGSVCFALLWRHSLYAVAADDDDETKRSGSGSVVCCVAKNIVSFRSQQSLWCIVSARRWSNEVCFYNMNKICTSLAKKALTRTNTRAQHACMHTCFTSAFVNYCTQRFGNVSCDCVCHWLRRHFPHYFNFINFFPLLPFAFHPLSVPVYFATYYWMLFLISTITHIASLSLAWTDRNRSVFVG